MRVFRLSKKVYASDLSGKGAQLAGGRWNPKGIPLIYTADSRALAMAEVAVHIPAGILPKEYCMIEIEVPEYSLFSLDLELLPTTWNSHPPIDFTKQIGETWSLKCEFLTLKVPSAVVEGDFNYLINPNHDLIKEVKVVSIKEFKFDSRLIS